MVLIGFFFFFQFYSARRNHPIIFNCCISSCIGSSCTFFNIYDFKINLFYFFKILSKCINNLFFLCFISLFF